MQTDLKKLGVFSMKAPKSPAICLDFVTLWGPDLNRAQLLRLCSAAIAVCIGNPFPKYPKSADPIVWGYGIVERLHNAGVSPADIYGYGVKALELLTGAILTEQEVKEEENFLGQPGADST